MKKQTLNNIAKKFFVGSILAAALFLSSQSKVYANNNNPRNFTAEKTNENASIKYVGNNQDNLLFNVKYNNVSGETFTLSVYDESGELIYSTVSKVKEFSKTYALPKAVDASKITFSIRSGKTNYRQSFDVNINTSVVENVVVSKI